MNFFDSQSKVLHYTKPVWENFAPEINNPNVLWQFLDAGLMDADFDVSACKDNSYGLSFEDCVYDMCATIIFDLAEEYDLLLEDRKVFFNNAMDSFADRKCWSFSRAIDTY